MDRLRATAGLSIRPAITGGNVKRNWSGLTWFAIGFGVGILYSVAIYLLIMFSGSPAIPVKFIPC